MTYQLSTDNIFNILEGQSYKNYQQQRTAEMIVQYYDFLNMGSVFENKTLRKAFSYAIDRKLILNKILEGEGESPGLHGVSPPVFKGYDITNIKGYDLNVKEAKKLLAKAGYPNGKGFPETTLTLNKGGGRYLRVAEEVKRQLKQNLNIDIKLNIVSFKEKLWLARSAKSEFSRSAWVADYPSPESFLSILYGKNVPSKMSRESFPNTSRYVNPKFDELYEKGLHATTIAEGMKYFMQAEQILMDDAPMIILWYDENYRILQANVMDFHNNPMQYRDFSKVWLDFSSIEEQQKKEAQEAKQTEEDKTASEKEQETIIIN